MGRCLVTTQVTQSFLCPDSSIGLLAEQRDAYYTLIIVKGAPTERTFHIGTFIAAQCVEHRGSSPYARPMFDYCYGLLAADHQMFVGTIRVTSVL